MIVSTKLKFVTPHLCCLQAWSEDHSANSFVALRKKASQQFLVASHSRAALSPNLETYVALRALCADHACQRAETTFVTKLLLFVRALIPGTEYFREHNANVTQVAPMVL